jgi:hypothetical protein
LPSTTLVIPPVHGVEDRHGATSSRLLQDIASCIN